MSDADLSLFLKGMTGIEIILYSACMSAFFYPFLKRKKGVAVVFGVHTVLYFANLFLPDCGLPFMAPVIAVLTAGAKGFGMDKKHTFLLGVLFYCVRILSGLAVASVNFFANNVFLKAAAKEETQEAVFHAVLYHYGFTVTLQVGLCAVMLYFVGRQWQKKRKPLHVRELCYLLLTPVTGILFGTVIFRLLIVVKDHTVFDLFEQFPVFGAILPLVALLFYAGILITIASYQKMTDLQEERETFFVEQQQVHAIQERMAQEEQFYDGVRQMRHEMKNHMTNIKGLIKSGSYADVEQYIDKMDESMSTFALTVSTGNAVTDVIVNDKRTAAEKQKTTFTADFIYPASDGYHAYDVGIILNNLLQNALEAVALVQENERYVSLTGKRKKRFFLIQVKNAFAGEVAFDERTGLPVSTKKEDSALHGIGLSNVKRMAEKYAGDVDIKVQKNEFCVTVLLQEKN